MFGKASVVCILLCLQLAWGLNNSSDVHCIGDDCQKGVSLMTKVMRLKLKAHKECVEEHLCPTPLPALSNRPCEDGKSGEYSCSNVDLLSFVPLLDLGSKGDGNDIWGWTDPDTGKEYAIVGCVDGTSFVDVTNPMVPIVVGFLPTHSSSSLWRDIKVYNDHAFIVSEAKQHGMQVFDLKQLKSLTPPQSGVNQLEATAHYDRMGNTHNIVSNEDTGFMYAVGTNLCRGGLHVIDVRTPLEPMEVGCFSEDGYVHDAQCVVYTGPDTSYKGREICFCYNENTLTIVDVEDKGNMKMLSRVGYDNVYYTHQGWLIEDQTHLILNDELDEIYGPSKNTRSMMWNVENLEKPKLIGSFYSPETAVDHNLYIKDNLVFETNYCAGLRVLDSTGIKDAKLEEVGYFDVAPDCNTPAFRGSWSSYVYFKSDTIVVSSIERGLFVLKYTGPK